jgi:hypothetical protein
VFGCLVAGAAISCCFGWGEPAKPVDSAPPGRTLFHPDPQHLWNRLHEALLARIGPDGRTYGLDRVEPLLWPGTKHLLEDRSRDRALALLEDFLKNKGEKLIDDPLKRAILQRDLWLVFSWLEGSHDSFADPPLSTEAWQASQKRLRRPLAAVIGRLALSPEQIKQLPDTYAAAVASGAFPRRFDPAQPDRPHLPPDLFATDGPWVCLGRPDGPVAPEHLREENGNPFTHSVFLVFLRLPAGRAATLDYLKRLRAFDQPFLVKADDAARGTDKYIPNPKLPQLPVGTEVALVRRALLIASTLTPMPTALTESVQLRVYREVPELTRKNLDAALAGGTADSRRAQAWQSFHEFRLSRALLFAGRAGGLSPVSADERDFKTGFGAHPWGELETQPFTGPRLPVKETCFACHSLPGVYSFNSFYHYRIANWRDGDSRRPAALTEASAAEVAEASVRWKQGRPSWTALRGLLVEQGR